LESRASVAVRGIDVSPTKRHLPTVRSCLMSSSPHKPPCKAAVGARFAPAAPHLA
jgi:hypothetical protein